MQTVEQTRDWLLSRARVPAATDTVDLLAAAGRVLAQDLVSTLDVPPCDNSAMDGYAVRAADATAALPVSQRIRLAACRSLCWPPAPRASLPGLRCRHWPTRW